MSLSLTWTLVILAACAAVLALAQIRERRKYEPGRIGLVPWLPIQFVALLGAILMIAHLTRISRIGQKPHKIHEKSNEILRLFIYYFSKRLPINTYLR